MPRTKHAYLCDVCNQQFAVWSTMRPCGTFPILGDFDFGVCNECRGKPEEKAAFVRLLVAAGGWTKAKAAKNYDETLTPTNPTER